MTAQGFGICASLLRSLVVEGQNNSHGNPHPQPLSNLFLFSIDTSSLKSRHILRPPNREHVNQLKGGSALRIG
jgi:hypothetical protein